MEIMQISRLEEEKKKGKLNLDHLKRKNKAVKDDNSHQFQSNIPNAVAPVMFQKKVGGL